MTYSGLNALRTVNHHQRRFKRGELIIARQFIGYASIGTIHLNYPALQAEEVECCYIFVRSGDGEKASDSMYVEVRDERERQK